MARCGIWTNKQWRRCDHGRLDCTAARRDCHPCLAVDTLLPQSKAVPDSPIVGHLSARSVCARRHDAAAVERCRNPVSAGACRRLSGCPPAGLWRHRAWRYWCGAGCGRGGSIGCRASRSQPTASSFLVVRSTAMAPHSCPARIVCQSFAAIALGAVPYMIADSLLSECGRAPIWRVLMARTAFVGSLGVAVALDFERLFFLLIIMPVIAVFFIIFGLMGGWVGRRTRSPMAAGLGLGLILAWALGVSFPLFVAA